jgi:type IV pilus assembly protein PilF
MKAVMMRLVLPMVAGIVIAGCASTGAGSASGSGSRSTSGEREVDNKAAASANAALGAEYMRRGQLRDAKDKLDRALQQDPSNSEANWVMALLLEQLDKPAESDRYYKTAMRLQPNNPDIANTYAVYLCKSGKSDDALPLFDALISNKLYREPWAAATNAAMCLRADKRNADALAYAERALTLRANYIDAVIQKADLQLDLGRSTQARQTIDAYLAVPKPKESDPYRPEVLLIGVRAGLAEGDRLAADSYARLLRRDFPSSPQTASLPQLLQGAR